jgi:hypothetical protein
VLGFALLFAVIGVVWFCCFAIELRNRESRSALRRWWFCWAAGPLVGVLICAAFVTGALGQARFALSEDGFEDAARSALAGGPDQRSFPATLGLFHVEQREVRGESVWFTLSGEEGVTENGLIWSPKGAPQIPEEEYAPHARHYTGHWYVWSRFF